VPGFGLAMLGGSGMLAGEDALDEAAGRDAEGGGSEERLGERIREHGMVARRAIAIPLPYWTSNRLITRWKAGHFLCND